MKLNPAALLGFAFLVCGCRTTFRITVRDGESGGPLEGVTMIATESKYVAFKPRLAQLEKRVTGRDGKIVIDGVPSRWRIYRVRFLKHGYLTGFCRIWRYGREESRVEIVSPEMGGTEKTLSGERSNEFDVVLYREDSGASR